MKGRQITKGRNPWVLAGMAVGIAAILVGLVFLFGFKDEIFYGSASSSSGGTTRLGTAAFGADFYTDIYKSTTFAGNAVKGVYELLSTCFGVLFILGAALAFAGMNLFVNLAGELPLMQKVFFRNALTLGVTFFLLHLGIDWAQRRRDRPII